MPRFRPLGRGIPSITLSALLVIVLTSPGTAQESGSDLVRLIHDTDRGEMTVEVGPLDLPAGAGHHQIEQPPLLTIEVPTDAYLYGFEIEMVDRHGEVIPGRLLHHVNIIDPNNRELFTSMARRVFAAGQDTPPGRVPRLIGMPLEEGQRLTVTSMFHNPTDRSYPGARLRVKLLYREAGWVFPLEVYPFYVDVMGPLDEKSFDLPPGRYERSWEGSPAIAGRVLAIGGHVHRYAEVLRLEDVTAGDVVWEVQPVTDSAGRVAEMPLGHVWKKGGVRLDPDHVYRLSVVYENPTGAVIPEGGMGALGGLFMPASGERWPAVDPQDSVYVNDLRLTRETAERRAMMSAADGEHGHLHH